MKYLTLLLALTPLFLFSQNSLPSIQVQTLDGKEVNIQDVVKDNDLTVISFWATWCKPCHKELDNIAELYPQWKKEYGVEVIAITIDDARAFSRVKPMVARQGWEYTILSDKNQDLQRALNFQTIPQTFIINTAGRIMYTHSGYVPGYEYILADKIKEFLPQ